MAFLRQSCRRNDQPDCDSDGECLRRQRSDVAIGRERLTHEDVNEKMRNGEHQESEESAAHEKVRGPQRSEEQQHTEAEIRVADVLNEVLVESAERRYPALGPSAGKSSYHDCGANNAQTPTITFGVPITASPTRTRVVASALSRPIMPVLSVMVDSMPPGR